MTPYRFSLGPGSRSRCGLGLAPGPGSGCRVRVSPGPGAGCRVRVSPGSRVRLLLFSLKNEEKMGQFSQQYLYKGL